MSGPAEVADFEPNRFEVDLGAVRGNVVALRAMVGPGCGLYAALKCDAYGFGLVPVARALAEAGVDALAVSRIPDALALREAGLTLPILLYAGAVVTPGLVEVVERNRLTPTILDLAAAERFSESLTSELPVFVKVDVGQRRLGVEPRELARFAVAVAGLPKLRLEGIYTHMTVPPDPVPERQLERQSELFGACLQEVEAAGLGVRVRMAASSSVLRLSNDMNFNAVDPGRLYFGIVPSGPATEEAPFRSALRSLRSTLLHVKTIDDDDRRPAPPVAAPPGMRLGIVALGIGDGLGSASCGHLLVRGRPAPILEPISLEHCRVDLTGVPDAAVGDEVMVIGTQGGETIGIDDVAAHRGLQANKHHVAISVRGSVPRRYIDDPA